MSSGRRKLLLADDSPTIQKVISLTFGDEDFEVVAVGDGAQAMRALAEGAPPDVVLADVVMPGPDGYELCERIKRDARLGRVPVVLLVGTFEPFNEAEARRVGADAVGLIGVVTSAGLDLHVDRVGITYSNGQSLGDPSSPVQLSSSVVGDRPIPTRAMPEVVARVGVDLDPVDVTDADDARWLRACLWPDQPERVARLEAEMALAATAPALLLRGNAVEVLPDAFARVPADALPVVTTTWALSHFPLESRLRFLHRLDEAAADRAVAWVSAEGVGVAPSIPTLGDRRASGHSIIGLAVFDRSALRAEAIGRCWSQGRLLAWLADSWMTESEPDQWS